MENKKTTGSFFESVGLEADVIVILRKANLDDPKKIITTSQSELAQLTNLPRNKICRIISLASGYVLKSRVPIQTVASVAITRQTLSVGCPLLNEHLQGGFCCGGITEIYGESASGKTQLCLQLCLTVQCAQTEQDIAGKAIYICTEDAFPSKRLNEMMEQFRLRNAAFKNHNFMDNIFISQIGSTESLMHCILTKLDILIKSRNVRLLIIDSLTASFRCDYDSDQNAQRSRDIQLLGYQLHKLANKYNLFVICVNQVVDNVDNSKPWCRNQDGKTVPALGLTWSNLVTTRVQLSRLNRAVKQYKTKNGIRNLPVPSPLCAMKIINSPFLPISSVNYVVTSRGVEGIN